MSAGLVGQVVELTAGSELVADVAAGASAITVEDPTDFNPEGGDLRIGGEERSYSFVNEDTGAITLDATLANAYTAEERVVALPEYLERFAFVQLEGQDETLQARVPHALYDRLVVGARDVNLDEGELVELSRDPGGELVIADVIDRAPIVDGSFVDPVTLPTPPLTDGLAPATSPTPTVFGGVLSLFVTWPTVANPDPVAYEVHVSTSSGFTPGVGTFAGESRGTLFVIRHLPGVTDPPAYGVTYYVKVIAKDDDGAAAASAEDSATPEEGMQSAIIADLIAANAIITEKLEAVLVLASTIVAGTLEAGRVELGIATDPSMGGMLGLHAMAADGVTPTFMLNSDTGEVFVRGNIEFGTDSALLSNDIVEMQQQPAGAFETPIIRQTAGGRSAGGSTVSASWTTATQTGATLFAVVACFDTDGTPPAFTTPAGWTLITGSDTTNGGVRMRAYKIEAAASRSGVETVTLGDAVYATLTLFELQGVGVQDVVFLTATGTSPSPAVGPSGTPTQSDELVLGGVVNAEITGGFGDSDNVTGNPSGFVGGASIYTPFVSPPQKPALWSHVWQRNITAAAQQSLAATLPDAEPWVAWVVTFKAKLVGVEAPAAGHMRWYGRELAGATFPHLTNAETEGAVVLGKAGEVWRLEVVRISNNFASIPADSGVTGAFTAATVKAGDVILFTGQSILSTGGANGRGVVFHHETPATTDGEIEFTLWNAAGVAADLVTKDFEFIVLHRGSP